ncbi:hypothetical protein [Klebsiella oxytoca]|uniref:hypothetical protein n=1 Tax=Klebsiella oxytoca TaxID=571 RepID=UPI0039C98E50
MLSTIIAMLLCFSPSVFSNDEFSCEVSHALYHDSFTIKASYRFILTNGNGILLVNGKVSDRKKHYIISREIRFVYSRETISDYLFTSDYIRKNPLDNVPNELLLSHYPSFFVKVGHSLVFHIERENKKDFIMSFVSVPFFYCNGSKSNN